MIQLTVGLHELLPCISQEPRPGFTKTTVAAWRVALEARSLASRFQFF
jgi:hypothetical protein